MQDKTILRVILLLFVATLGLLYYNNSFNEVTMYVAGQNIAKDSQITNNHIASVVINRENLFPGAITDKNIILEQVAAVNIQEGDVFTKRKISGATIDASQKYYMRIPVDKSNSPAINAGSLIRVYLVIDNQREGITERYIVMDEKIVEHIDEKGYHIRASDTEVESYLIASKLGDITSIKINDLSLPDLNTSTPRFIVSN